MGRPKECWYNLTVTALKNRRKMDKETMQYMIIDNAIKQALEESKANKYGEEIRKVAEMVYIKETHTMLGAADVLHIGTRTAKRRGKIFLETVAKYAGYKK